MSTSILYVMWGLLLSIASFSYAVCPIITPVDNPTYNSINPVTGENVWQIIKRTADAIDDLGPIAVATAIELNDLVNTSSMCCECTCFITQADVPLLVISQPGIYCVSEDILVENLSSVNMIDIQSNNVVIDLHGHTITGINCGGSRAINVSGHTNITIKNGAFEWEGAPPITTSSCDQVVIENCKARNTFFAEGISVSGSNNIRVNNCSMKGGGNAGLSITSCTNAMVSHCFSETSSPGFRLGGVNIVAYNCYAYSGNTGFDIRGSATRLQNCSSTGANTGFLLWLTSSGVDLYNCSAFNATFQGFDIMGSLARLENCTATGCTDDGFHVNASAAVTSRIEIIGCYAANNTGFGINNGPLTNSHIFNNVSVNNTAGNYNNVTPLTLIPSGSVTTSTGYWSNING